MTSALDALQVALADVDNIIKHHPKATQPSRGRPKTDEGPLLRSCVLLIYAAWEVYVEDSLVWAVEQLARSSDPESLPVTLRSFVAGAIGADPWQLAGDAWRTAAVAAVVNRVRGGEDEDSFGVNTAGPRQINGLHDQVLGERLLDQCRWQRMSTKRVKQELATLVRIRGAIAHTGKTEGPLHLVGVREWRSFIERLARRLDSHLTAWVADRAAIAAE